jgi:hypothetical protein
LIAQSKKILELQESFGDKSDEGQCLQLIEKLYDGLISFGKNELCEAIGET